MWQNGGTCADMLKTYLRYAPMMLATAAAATIASAPIALAGGPPGCYDPSGTGCATMPMAPAPAPVPPPAPGAAGVVPGGPGGVAGPGGAAGAIPGGPAGTAGPGGASGCIPGIGCGTVPAP